MATETLDDAELAGAIAGGATDLEPGDDGPTLPDDVSTTPPLTFDDTERVSRQGNPRHSVVEILQKRLERVLQPVDDDEVWHGVNVITRRDFLEAMVLPLPPASSQAASVTTPAFIYVDAVCPVCSVATEISLEVGVKLVAEGYSRKLQLVPKSKDLPHQCGQLRIRDVTPTKPVRGQTAIDFGNPDADDGEGNDDVEPNVPPLPRESHDQVEDPDDVDRDAVHALAAVKPPEAAKDDLSDLDDLPF